MLACNGAMEFDDLKQCAACFTLPFLSCTACSCDQETIVCTQCAFHMVLRKTKPGLKPASQSVVSVDKGCLCPATSRLVMEWFSLDVATALLQELREFVQRTSVKYEDQNASDDPS